MSAVIMGMAEMPLQIVGFLIVEWHSPHMIKIMMQKKAATVLETMEVLGGGGIVDTPI